MVCAVRFFQGHSFSETASSTGLLKQERKKWNTYIVFYSIVFGFFFSGFRYKTKYITTQQPLNTIDRKRYSETE